MSGSSRSRPASKPKRAERKFLGLRRAVRFYEKHGYGVSGTIGDFYGMPLYEYVKLL
jgi:hypothetical protein